jgi:hypothetical protein
MGSLTGKGIKPQRRSRASALPARQSRGKAKLKVTVTYTPNGTATGDVVGDPKIQNKRVTLIKSD